MLVDRKNVLLIGIITLLIASNGCGGERRGHVEGRVSLDGVPIDGGEIRFLPNIGLPACADIIQGQYVIPAARGPSLGPVRVEVRWTRKTGKKVLALPPAPPGSLIEETAQAVPARFNRESELQVEIKPGKNSFDFALDSRGGSNRR